MNGNPLISVIINCYNGEKYIREAIDSVIAQTYTNWEIIFWDNQSTDSTAEIVNSYDDSRIRYIYAPIHTPLGEARNLALNEIKGKYICFLDADDYWYNNFLHSFLNVFLENKNIGFAYSRFINLYTNTSSEILSHGGNISHQVSTDIIIRDYHIAMSSTMINGKVLKKLENKYFNSCYSLIEDFDFYIRLASVSEVYYIADPLTIYRIHSNNTSYSDKWVSEFNNLLKSIISNEPGYEFLVDYIDIIRARINYYKLIAESSKKNRLYLVLRTLKNVIFRRIAPKHLLLPILGKTNYFKLQARINKFNS